jgi:hypothetical protein
MYTLQGILDYQLHSDSNALLMSSSDVKKNIQRFLEESWVREFPVGPYYPSDYPIDRPARLWGIGYLLYLSASLHLDVLADTIYAILITEYEQQEMLILRPDLEDTTFYPRHVTHVLFGLSYYAWA